MPENLLGDEKSVLNNAILLIQRGFFLSKKSSRGFWVDGRPAVILDHQVIQRTAGGAIVAVRDFYVGHSFNSSQMVLAILPYRNGSLVLYSHYTSSDQVAGVGAGLKRAIGRGHLRAVMFERMERLRASAR
jgi:hypothetical protein